MQTKTVVSMKPKMKLGPTASKDSVRADMQEIRSQAATSSHNTFRPDIYRVSEGYLN